MNIRMVDTVGQYGHIQSEIDTAVLEVVRSGAYINGPSVKQFKQNLSEYLDGAAVIPCANGTDALQVALMALDLEPGDEVITPSFTFVATVEVIELLGLIPVYADVDPETFNMSPAAIEEAITPKTKVIIPVHLFGQVADMEPIMEIAAQHKLAVVEDTAQAIGATYTFSDGRTMMAGTIGDIGTTSFYPSKNLGAFGDGGAIFSRNEQLAEKIQTICNHGSRVKYYHESIGVNSRLDSIQAAILDIKLKHLNEYNAARQEAAKRYDEMLKDVQGIQLPKWKENGSHVFHQYTLRILGGRSVRDALKQSLADAGIPSMVYYPVCIHLQGAYQTDRFGNGSLPISEQMTEEVLSLPMHTELDEAQQRFITDTLKEQLPTFEITH
ncbi:DegT/DnrJ/EryC1/StrS family aminotransferase [Pontibacter sp. G13]|uniref:DegT/DnrJ/EryC1/StrS family aminotransferase n=1 Tax=Pontibacter sp. G13 TaxID=3074898 RepID=UPI00288A907E|nr:DegT/DnrJ/EryC1/StrS family aminotransferase [Pontibacter sp. G13]WNJ16040.1 DegT/DnrJ/EryC1/StrS family aminotransferase [Pontibacter sp. G13]